MPGMDMQHDQGELTPARKAKLAGATGIAVDDDGDDDEDEDSYK